MEPNDHFDPSREERIPLEGRDYADDRRREMWDERVDLDREYVASRSNRGGYRGKGRGEWGEGEFAPEHEWDRGRRPLDWEAREGKFFL